jgi:Predicted O-methyltransferase
METETLKNGTKVYVGYNSRFGYDALILSNFAFKKHSSRILDLGTGCGIIPLAAADAGRTGECVGLDIDDVACAFARRGAAEYMEQNKNGMKIEIVYDDLRNYSASKKFDVVVCNPPYFALGTGKLSAKVKVRAARHEMSCTIADIAASAKRNLKQGGRFFISYRPNRLVDAISAFRAERLEPKRLRFVRQTPQGEPWLVLVEARFDAGIGLEVAPDLVVETAAGGYTEEMANIVAGTTI